jgi:hypothetical protein
MFSIFALWLPIVVFAMALFVASSVMHRPLTYHDSDFFHRLPAEDAYLSQLQPHGSRSGRLALQHTDVPVYALLTTTISGWLWPCYPSA